MNENEAPSPELIARQLRQPSGELGTATGYTMNKTNASLYDLVLDTMNLKEGESVLEIGFGNGKLFDKLFSAAGNLLIKGLDYSADMVSEAIENNKERIETGHLELHKGSSDNMPFADNSFDKICCCNVIYFWDDPAAHLKEVYRVLKPGGIFYAGFRSRSSMEAFPFTRFGFTLYEEPEWKMILQANHFLSVASNQRTEILEMDDTRFELQSCCTAGQK